MVALAPGPAEGFSATVLASCQPESFLSVNCLVKAIVATSGPRPLMDARTLTGAFAYYCDTIVGPLRVRKNRRAAT